MLTFDTTTDLLIGGQAPDFQELSGIDGKSYRLSSFDDKPVLAVVFFANGCPTVRVYDDRLKGLQDSYGPKGLQIVAINSNNPHLSPSDTLSEMRKRAGDGGFPFPYLKDEDGSVARAFGAIATPHVFLLDSDRHLRYRGRIDDSRDPSKITSHDLKEAITGLIEGRAVEVSETEPFGCAVVR